MSLHHVSSEHHHPLHVNSIATVLVSIASFESHLKMPPHLHPRSRSTMSLFAATLLASLFVVGIPHVFPCPAPRRTLADSEMIVTADGQQIQKFRRKRRKDPNMLEQDGTSIHQIRPQSSDEEVSTFLQMEEEAERLANTWRECPVPKPKGVLGQLLGFSTAEGKQKQRTLGTESVTATNQGG